MAEKLFALSEDTKNKVLELIGRKPAPDKYANKTPVMREYYSRMWLVWLQNDIPPMSSNDCNQEILNRRVVYYSPAWVLELVDIPNKRFSTIERRIWKGDFVVIDKVYNPINKWARAYDENGEFIVYYAIKDMFGKVWLWRPDTLQRKCPPPSSSSGSSSSFSAFSNSSDSNGSKNSPIELCCKNTGFYCMQEYEIEINQREETVVVDYNEIHYPEIHARISGWFLTPDLPVGEVGSAYWLGSNSNARWNYPCLKPQFPGRVYWDSGSPEYAVEIVKAGQKCCFDEEHYSKSSEPDNLCYFMNMWNKLDKKGLTWTTNS